MRAWLLAVTFAHLATTSPQRPRKNERNETLAE